VSDANQSQAFPVQWDDPADAERTWTYDPMHNPEVLPPLAHEFHRRGDRRHTEPRGGDGSQYGIPAVLGVVGARDGLMLEVDGSNGTVRIL
jgi:hypothetical protein